MQPLIAANALDSIGVNFGGCTEKLASEWQNSILTSNTLTIKLFNKTTKSTLPAASQSLALNSAATSSSPESNKANHVISSTYPLFRVADIDVTTPDLMPPDCNLARFIKTWIHLKKLWICTTM